ncbi:MAG: OmpA family protein [Reyranella sp.]|nr:OmpA family protein [Reyranella sp.]
MPTSSVAVRSITLAVLGLGAASAAFAQGSNVTAFNPYSGVGLPGGPVPQYGPQAAYPIVDTVGPAGAGGPAFNPWLPGGGVSAAYPVSVSAGAVSAGAPAPIYSYNPGTYLPAPPPGPIESRIVAIPELGNAPSRSRSYTLAPAHTPPPQPLIAPPMAARPEPAPTPKPAAPAPIAVAPAPPPAATPTPAPAPPTRPVAAFASPLPPEPAIPPAKGAVAASVAFAGQSAELSDSAKTDLDRLAKNLGDRSLRQIEIRAYAGGGDPESRKVSLARALVVRSYLIDRGVKARIEVGAYGGDSRGGGSERVDILVPNS